MVTDSGLAGFSWASAGPPLNSDRTRAAPRDQRARRIMSGSVTSGRAPTRSLDHKAARPRNQGAARDEGRGTRGAHDAAAGRAPGSEDSTRGFTLPGADR